MNHCVYPLKRTPKYLSQENLFLFKNLHMFFLFGSGSATKNRVIKEI